MDPTNLLHYRITGKLGSGGMGEVFEAEDTKLGRKVALKILPRELASRKDALERFRREARSLATLSHPNIVTIYSVEQEGETHFLTMELVRGSRLTELIPKTGMDLPQMFKIAIPLADSLAAAHEKGIGHRDLKPSNIMVNEKGHVKVIDFGLAKLLDSGTAATASGDDPTKPMTVEGKVLGTPFYMSPEQVEGRAADHRSDIFSLGIVLTELLTGQRPFKGDTIIAVMSSILKDDPPSVSELRPEIPTEISRVIRRCLQKNPDERMQSALDIRNELQELQKEFQAGVLTTTKTATGLLPARRPTPVWKYAVGIGCAAVLLLALLPYFRGGSKDEDVSSSVPESNSKGAGSKAAPRGFPTINRLTREDRIESMPCWSPDGNHIAFVTGVGKFKQIFVRPIDSADSIQVTSGDYDHIQPTWGPGTNTIYFSRSAKRGESIGLGDSRGGAYFSQEATVCVLDLTARKETVVVTDAVDPSVASGGQDLFFVRNYRVFKSDLKGGRIEQLSRDDVDQMAHSDARVSADGSKVVYRRTQLKQGQFHIAVVHTNHQTTLVRTNGYNLNPTWHPSGSHIYFTTYRGSGMNVWRIPVKASGAAAGDPESVTVGGGQDLEPAFSPDGKKMLFTVASQNADIYRISVDPVTGKHDGSPGEPMPFNSKGEDSRAAWAPSVTEPMIAFNSDRDGDMNLYIWRQKDNSVTRVTTGPGGDYQPSWSPDLQKLAFFSSRNGNADIYVVSTNANSTPQRLTDAPGLDINPFFSPDGKRIAFITTREGTGNLYVMNSDGTGQRKVVENAYCGHFVPWFDSENILDRVEVEGTAHYYKIHVTSGTLTKVETVTPVPDIGGHSSVSPDKKHFMDLNGPHSHIWVLSTTSNDGGWIYQKPDPTVTLDYPQWSPDGKWATFDFHKPRNSEIFLADWTTEKRK